MKRILLVLSIFASYAVSINGAPRMVKKSINGDGSCLFSSFQFVIKRGTLESGGNDRLRQLVTSEIDRHPHIYTADVLGTSRESYKRNILRRSTWGGGMELTIFSNYYKTEIGVCNVADGRMMVIGDGGVKNDTIVFIVYSRSQDHYDAMYRQDYPRAGDITTIFKVNDRDSKSAAKQLCRSLSGRPYSSSSSSSSDPPSPRTPSSRTPVPVPRAPVSAPRTPVSVPRTPVSVPRRPVSAPRTPVSVPRSPVSVPRTPVPVPARSVSVPEASAPVSGSSSSSSSESESSSETESESETESSSESSSDSSESSSGSSQSSKSSSPPAPSTPTPSTPTPSTPTPSSNTDFRNRGFNPWGGYHRPGGWNDPQWYRNSPYYRRMR